MRRGIGRARLCDLAGCPEKWPCPTHCTRRVGDYEHLGVHAGAFELASIAHGAEVVSETVPCNGCGWALCSCAPKTKLCGKCGYPAREYPPCACKAPTLADPHFVAPAECDHCGARKGLVPVAHGTAWGCGDANACHQRMATRRRVESALRPGWTTDGESYFNDAIGLMVARVAISLWNVYGNGDRWPHGYVAPSPDGQPWVRAERAMRWAEGFARNERERFSALAEALSQ